MTDMDIRPYIAPGRRAHLIGIGGVSMAPLAEVLHGAGMVITGWVLISSPQTAHLKVTLVHSQSMVTGASAKILPVSLS